MMSQDASLGAVGGHQTITKSQAYSSDNKQLTLP